MSVKDQISGGMIEGIMKMLPTTCEIDNPVSQFVCDELDKILEDTEVSRVIKSQLSQKANNDPNGVLNALVTLYNDRTLETMHNNIGEFVKSLNESAPTEEPGIDDPDTE